MKNKRNHRPGAVAAALLLALTVHAAEPAPSNSPPREVLLLDSLGRLVKVPTNEVPTGLQPPAAVGLKEQVPTPTPGASQPGEVLQRSRDAEVGFRWFPAVPPPLMPYLASQDEYGNTAVAPLPLISFFPFEPLVQGGKYWLSEYGLRYSLEQNMTYVSMSGIKEGNSTLGFYSLDFKGKWALFDAPTAGTAGWISGQIEAKSQIGNPGAGTNSTSQDAKRNLGTTTDPTGIWSSIDGVRVPELAWQQSFRGGEVVAIAGMVNQGNYIDQNAYAQSGHHQFMNSALISSRVMPLEKCQFGWNLQWQPINEFYSMFGGSAGNNAAGFAPWTDFNLNAWSLLWEFGYAPKDFLGLGPGIYRIQPFIAQVSTTQITTLTGSTSSVSSTNQWLPVEGGLCFDLQQKLGPHSPYGWFGRFGFGGKEVSNGAAAEVGTGFVWQGPFHHALLDRTSNDLLGVGFVWSQPSATSKTVVHQNEYVLEAFYALQLSPTLKVQPDFQFVTNPAFNSVHDHAMVFQLQLDLAW